MPRREFYPEIEPFATGYLSAGGPHQIYWEQSGNPKGAPVIFLHGGPGAGASPAHRRFFDPQHYRIIIFDQRGCGRSKPLGETTDNTTPHLIADMEKLRTEFGIDRWHVFGGSWGSTLALAYAEHHPERVKALALRGIFLCRKSEIDWFLFGMQDLRAGDLSRLHRASAAGRARRSAAPLLPAAGRSRSQGAYAGGAEMERL